MEVFGGLFIFDNFIFQAVEEAAADDAGEEEED